MLKTWFIFSVKYETTKNSLTDTVSRVILFAVDNVAGMLLEDHFTLASASDSFYTNDLKV